MKPLASHRRRAIAAGVVLLPWLPATAMAGNEPEVAAFKAFVGARDVRYGRLMLEIPRLAENGNAVPVKVSMQGPFAAGAEIRSIHLFSEINPVPQMAVFHFPAPVARVQVESRVRLAGSQRVAAVATMADGSLHAATADVIVTISACTDAT